MLLVTSPPVAAVFVFWGNFRTALVSSPEIAIVISRGQRHTKGRAMGIMEQIKALAAAEAAKRRANGTADEGLPCPQCGSRSRVFPERGRHWCRGEAQCMSCATWYRPRPGVK